MTVICLILFMCVAALWFLANEYPVLFGIFVPTCTLRRHLSMMIVFITLLFSVFLSHTGDISGDLSSLAGDDVFDSQSVLIMLLSALIVLTVMKVSGLKGPAVYALWGGIEACRISAGHEISYRWLLSFAAAPILAFVLSYLINRILKKTVRKSNIHLLTLSYHMRNAVIACLVLTAFALGLNWGGFLTGAGYVLSGSGSPLPVVMILAAVILAVCPFMRDMLDESTGDFADFSIYTVISVSLSASLTLLAFSFDEVAGLAGLAAAPLSVTSLVYASIAGAEMSDRTHMIEPELYFKEIAALVLTPAGSLLTTFLILYLTGNNDDNLVDFTVMSAAVIVLVGFCFIGYARRQRNQKELTDRLVHSQQQQIYEHSRALNDMQLKVVISENQALHNAVEMKRQEVMNVALSIVEQKEYLESLNEIVKRISASTDEKEKDALISDLGTSLKQRLSYDRDVDTSYFYAQAESLHEDFNAKLSENFPYLTQQERRLATLLRLGFSSKYIATLMNITVKSVEISRYRLRQKLGLSKGDNLVNFIKSI